MASELTESPTFMWVYDSFSGLLTRFNPTRMLALLYNDTLTETLPIKGCYSTGISDLPEEILVYILQFLDHKDLGRCERVCTEWKNVIHNRPALWSHVKIEDTPPGKSSKAMNVYCRMSQQEKLVSYVNHLVMLGARVETLTINLERYNEATYNVVAFLISSGCCAHLQKSSITWTEDCSYGATAEFEKSYIFHLSTLELLNKFSPELTNLRTQFNWTFDSINYLSKFKKLQNLDILCVPRVHTIQKWHLEKILNHLTSLESLKLRVTMMPPLQHKLNLVSKSLKRLDVSHCVNFVVGSMDLPNLEVLEGESMQCHRQVIIFHRSFCFYDVLENGCPSLKRVNDWTVRSKEPVFGLPFEKQCQMKICHCSRHRMQPQINNRN